MNIRLLAVWIGLAGFALGQTTPSTQSAEAPPPPAKTSTSAKRDVGSGAGDVGKGVAKGAGSAGKGVGQAAGDLVTLHPVNAAGHLGGGAVKTGKNVGVGAAKGTGKMLRGAGKGIKHLF